MIGRSTACPRCAHKPPDALENSCLHRVCLLKPPPLNPASNNSFASRGKCCGSCVWLASICCKPVRYQVAIPSSSRNRFQCLSDVLRKYLLHFCTFHVNKQCTQLYTTMVQSNGHRMVIPYLRHDWFLIRNDIVQLHAGLIKVSTRPTFPGILVVGLAV